MAEARFFDALFKLDAKVVEELEEIDRLALMVVDYIPGLVVEEAVDSDRLVESMEGCMELWVCGGGGDGGGEAEFLVHLVEELEEIDGVALMVVDYRPGLWEEEAEEVLECKPELVVESRSEMAVHRREAKVYEKAVDGSSDANANAKLAI
ncbi:hypothetical protein SASPL_122119 [Salvia splendens]|uniref:Uncharacterized protein n=1 Tax=Salvia splendens TaxID=180675 RepID=A0A8X8XJ05_SALSN|nr:hypothetical protein SASPL_122119 [Salvia splendens]